jgi:DNA mismatch repair protein MutS2
VHPTIDRDALRVLELPRFLDWLARRAESSVGREAVLAAALAGDAPAARTRLAETREALAILRSGDAPSLAIRDDALPHLVHAREQGLPLLARELAALYRFVKRARRLREAFLEREDVATLTALCRQMPDLGPLLRELEDAIDESGQLMDSATARLRTLRLEIAEGREQVRRGLERFARRPDVRPLLHAMHPAIRDGRYVLAVRATARSQVKGLYHDRSSTGQTAYVEPEVVVDMQNRLRDLAIDEEREVARILRRLTSLALEREADVARMRDGVARLDFAFARARAALELSLVEPDLDDRDELPALEVVDARHPLLLAMAYDRELAARGVAANGRADEAVSAIDRAASGAAAQLAVVPFSLSLGLSHDLLVLTGPNTGGKTATLKALGLLAILPRFGAFVAAAGRPRIPFYPGVFADVGDDQDLAQNLSTFSAHVKRVSHILAVAPRGSLVLLDELGSGTDPLEGEALAASLLEELLARGLPSVVTTHMGKLKEFAGRRPRAANASMAFDGATLKPTYRLLVGVPGASNALRIASDLGLPDVVVQRAQRALVGGGERADDLFAQLDRSRAELERLRDEAARLRDDAQHRATLVDRRETEVERIEAALLLSAEVAAEVRLKAYAAEIEPARRQLLALGGKAAQVAGRLIEALRVAFAGSPLAEHRRRFLRSLRPGDLIEVARLGDVGKVRRVKTKDEAVEVEVRNLVLTVGVEEIAPLRRGVLPPERRRP